MFKVKHIGINVLQNHPNVNEYHFILVNTDFTAYLRNQEDINIMKCTWKRDGLLFHRRSHPVITHLNPTALRRKMAVVDWVGQSHCHLQRTGMNTRRMDTFFTVRNSDVNVKHAGMPGGRLAKWLNSCLGYHMPHWSACLKSQPFCFCYNILLVHTPGWWLKSWILAILMENSDQVPDSSLYSGISGMDLQMEKKIFQIKWKIKLDIKHSVLGSTG